MHIRLRHVYLIPCEPVNGMLKREYIMLIRRKSGDNSIKNAAFHEKQMMVFQNQTRFSLIVGGI